MSVITLSRQYGSGGDEIAQRLCQHGGCRLFDKHMLIQAALEAGLSEQEVFDYSEQNYKVKNLFERLFGRLEPIAQMSVWEESADGVRIVAVRDLDEEDALALVRRAVEAAHQNGNFIIMGRGGQVILRDYPDVLHVRIEAPLEERISRVRARLRDQGFTYSTLVEERRAAQDLIAANDMASADYLKRIYNVDWADPQLYHLTINTGRTNLDLAAHIIWEAALQLTGEAVHA